MPSKPVALTIAGSDPSGGAGLQADLKTFHQFGVYGMAVPVVLTAQNTLGVHSIAQVDARFVRSQLSCLDTDIQPDAAKTGALGTAAVVREVAAWSHDHDAPVVVDPVTVSSSGEALSDDDAFDTLKSDLIPACFLVTPNLSEASALAGIAVHDPASMRHAAERIANLGVRRVLVKGGHLKHEATDLLWIDGEVTSFRARRTGNRAKHGTGCTLSAAITALLARGRPLVEAVGEAKLYVAEAIRSAPRLGRGHGPLNHHAPVNPANPGSLR